MAFYCWTSSSGLDEYKSAIDLCDTVVGDYPYSELAPTCVLRVSQVAYPVGSQATSDKLRLPGTKAYDELTKGSLTEANTVWWESVLYAVQTPLIVAFVWNIADSLTPDERAHLDRIVRACRDNPYVKIAVEGFHFGVYGVNCRNSELAVKSVLAANGFPFGRTILLLCVSDRPDIASQYGWTTGLAYSSRQPAPYAAYVADRDSVKDWWNAGCRDFGTWGTLYATQSSRNVVSKAMQKGLELAGVYLM